MSHVVRKHLRLESDAYDAAIRTFIPGYEEALTRAASEIAGVHPTLVLDLGTGTGALAEALLAHDRVGAVEALDIDPEMLAQARLRLTRFGPRKVQLLDRLADGRRCRRISGVGGRWFGGAAAETRWIASLAVAIGTKSTPQEHGCRRGLIGCWSGAGR